MGTLFFIIGCGTPPAPVAKVKIVKKPVYVAHVPQRTHKNIKLKEVQDDNFSSDYMYPKTKRRKKKLVFPPQLQRQKLPPCHKK